MRGVVLGEGGEIAVAEVPEPTPGGPDDALVRVRRAAICGSDLHVRHGRLPGVLPGVVMGHEFTGVVEHVGESVDTLVVGDRVVGSFLMPCRACTACERREYQLCEDLAVPGYGMFFGDLPGAQAEHVRARNADLSLLRIPEEVSDEQALLIGDNLTTAYYASLLGQVGPGTFTVVQGCGPVGLLALDIARARGADPLVAVDVAADRLEHARRLGAEVIDAGRSSPGVAIEAYGDGRGAEVVIDAAGGPPALLMQAFDLVRPGGRVAVIGVYSDLEATIPLAELWVRAVTLAFGGTCPVPALWHDVLELVRTGAVDPGHVITHRLPLAEAARGYELFESRAALKVVLEVSG